jgi:hypothetical protein
VIGYQGAVHRHSKLGRGRQAKSIGQPWGYLSPAGHCMGVTPRLDA